MRPPVDVVVTSPARFSRVQLAVRFAIALALGFVGFSVGWLASLLYVVLPVIASVAISSGGARGYLGETGPRLWRALTWLLQFSAFMMLLTDRFPVGGDEPCRAELHPAGTPSPGRAVLRLLTSLPAAVFMSILWLVSGVFCLIGWLTILFAEMVPQPILGFQRAVLRAQARLLAYHACLVDRYPPFSLDTHEDLPRAIATVAHR
jgi:hypothetical protein